MFPKNNTYVYIFRERERNKIIFSYPFLIHYLSIVLNLQEVMIILGKLGVMVPWGYFGANISIWSTSSYLLFFLFPPPQLHNQVSDFVWESHLN